MVLVHASSGVLLARMAPMGSKMPKKRNSGEFVLLRQLCVMDAETIDAARPWQRGLDSSRFSEESSSSCCQDCCSVWVAPSVGAGQIWAKTCYKKMSLWLEKKSQELKYVKFYPCDAFPLAISKHVFESRPGKSTIRKRSHPETNGIPGPDNILQQPSNTQQRSC